MPHVRRIGGLDISENLGYQRRDWRVQRIGWLAIAAVLAAAGFGAFGRGPLSSVDAATADGTLRVHYHRFWRRSSPMELAIEAVPDAVRAGELRVRIARGYLDRMQLQRVAPEPLRAEIGGDYVTFVFAAGETTGPLRLRFVVEAALPGTAGGTVGLAEGSLLRIDQLIYP